MTQNKNLWITCILVQFVIELATHCLAADCPATTKMTTTKSSQMYELKTLRTFYISFKHFFYPRTN